MCLNNLNHYNGTDWKHTSLFLTTVEAPPVQSVSPSWISGSLCLGSQFLSSPLRLFSSSANVRWKMISKITELLTHAQQILNYYVMVGEHRSGENSTPTPENRHHRSPPSRILVVSLLPRLSEPLLHPLLLLVHAITYHTTPRQTGNIYETTSNSLNRSNTKT